ncbi:MAG: glycerophosphoryl diester phosphodiesterase [Lactobacillus sp.]|jgi:glycerophosphoryl diester phosphodiesterase|nr:glycerophosphoryl diester phosphodiesterase [Lactobacillus sp.]MCH3905221.1 glycerophosphoryl diester phosphodiesterase [Lactobacillus sp.]MCH3905488.1 glycerophosphoryl diester phosphodiesterase [Lactobacillus sp.]MCH3990947.1 glycerophosphoryl diester phosphodiesterase [Lactobacillus sp.]MCH3990974.1 glycerophosphoryl diester phosphodiesterase [Lactobacillus sp.]
MSEKRIFSHRGMSTLAPENTIPAFELMHKYGANWLETDLGITKDEKLVIIHDDYLDRTTNGHGRVVDHTFDEIRSLDAGSWFSPKFKGTKVPTLDELIEVMNKYKLNANFELKAIIGEGANHLADSEIKQFAAKLDEIDPECKILISSFNPIMLLKLRKLRPDLDYACLFETHTLYEDWPLICEACGAKTIHPQSEGLTRGQVQEWKDMGYKVNVWTCDTIDRANELWNWGVDGVFTDITQSFPTHQREDGPHYGKFLTTWF